MSNHLALNETEGSVTTPGASRPLRLRVARQVSNILSPVVVSLPTVFFVAFYRAQDIPQALLYAFIMIVFLSIGPIAYIAVGVRTGKLSDMDVSIRTQRVGPFLFTTISEMIGLLILIQLHAPKNLETLLLATALTTALLMIITLWWKISIHSSTLSGAISILVALYGPFVLASFVLVGVVSWSRIVLGRHTLAQVIAGAALSIIICIVVVGIRGI
jgi:membrane-associated phospholipid phosphatase